MWVIYEYWFARMKNISDNKKKKLREAYGSAKEIYYIEETVCPVFFPRGSFIYSFPESIQEK